MISLKHLHFFTAIATVGIMCLSTLSAQGYAKPDNNNVALTKEDAAAITGDVDDNGIVDPADAIMILQMYARTAASADKRMYTEHQIEAADVNADGTVTVDDAILVLTFYAKTAAGRKPIWNSNAIFVFSDNNMKCKKNDENYTGMIANADSDVYYYQDGMASKGVYEIDGEKHYFSYETGIMQKESADGYVIKDGTVLYEPTSPLLSSDLFGVYYERATEIMNTMTLEEKVGQLFLMGITQTNGEDVVKNYHPSGIVMFAYNFSGQTISSEQEQIASYQASSRFPLLISVDEEGGAVVRVSKYPAFRDTPFLSPQKLYAQGGWDGVYQETIEKRNLLKSLGINLCLAPVADISNNPNDYIYERTFGGSAEDTSQFIEISTKAYRETNTGCTLKHFPGYASNLNTHNGSSVDNREQSQFYENDLKPFQAGIDAGAPVVMVNHNIVSCFDAENPASISPEVHSVLRKDLHFSGLICTDSLDMGATKNVTDVYLKAVDAGNDLIATCETAGYPIILQAVHTGKISENRVNESVIRILAYKLYYGLIS